MQKKLLRTSLFGFSKTEVCDYIARVNDDFNSKIDLLTAEPQREDTESLDLKSVEQSQIIKVLRHTGGNKTEAARLLKIGLTTLYRKIDEYEITV